MKRGINLFKKTAQRPAIYPSLIKYMYGGLICCVFLFLSLVTFFVLQYLQAKQFEKANIEKEGVIALFKRSSILDNQTSYLAYKSEFVEQKLKNDAQFNQYFTILNTIFASHGPAILDNLNVDKNLATRFTIRFKTLDQLDEFLIYAESEDFLQYFQTLSLNTVSIVDNLEHKYELTFKGSFKKLNETPIQ